MKHGLFLCVLSLLSLTAAAQSYPQLIRLGVEWDVMHGGPEICWLTGGDRYYFRGDSAIAGKTYAQVWAWHVLQSNPGPFCPPFYVDTNVTYRVGLMREDTVARQAFWYDEGVQRDSLLYDFSLAAGDTLALVYPGLGGPLIVDSIGTETLLSGTVVRRYFLNNLESYAEAIGGTQGLHNFMYQGSGVWEEPGCIRANGLQLWGANCLGLVGVEEALLAAKPWKLVASGVGEVQVQGPAGKVGQLVISDGLGRMVLEAEVRQGDQFNVPSGLLVWNIGWEGAVAGGKALIGD